MPSLSDAIALAYAQAPQGVVYYEAIALDHPAWAGPLYLITGLKEKTIDLPLEFGDPPVTWNACGMTITPPGEGPDGPTGLNLVISAVASDLIPYLRQAALGSSPISVTYYQYVSSDLTKPGDLIDGIKINKVEVDAVSATAQPVYEEIDTQAFPLFTYDEEFYPMLQNPGDNQG